MNRSLAYNYIHDASRFVPKVDSNRCVHTKIEIATCKKCVDACPHLAWVLDDETLALDAKTCDGCGLCAAACTEQAIKYQYDHKIKSYKKSNISFFACEYAADILSKDQNIFCVNTVSLVELLRLYAQGVRTLIISTGDCTDCLYDCSPNLTDNLKKINLLLSSRRQANIKLLKVDAKKFKSWQSSLPSAFEKNTRRGFLLNLLTSGAELAILKEDKALSMHELLPANKVVENDALYPFVPSINEVKCSACNACVQLCPHQSLILNQEQLCFEIKPENCTGCAICTDVCDQSAISLHAWSKAHQLAIKLAGQKCTSCGVEFKLPVASNLSNEFCPICTRSNKNQNLYQVINI